MQCALMCAEVSHHVITICCDAFIEGLESEKDVPVVREFHCLVEWISLVRIFLCCTMISDYCVKDVDVEYGVESDKSISSTISSKSQWERIFRIFPIFILFYWSKLLWLMELVRIMYAVGA